VIALILFVYLCSFPLLMAEEKSKGSVEKSIPQSLQKIISLTLENASLEEALTRVARIGNVKLNYNRDRIPLTKNISLQLKDVTAYEALEKILEDTGAELLITAGGQLAVVPVKISDNREAEPQTGIVQGLVSDYGSGSVLPAVSVELEGSGLSAATDSEGFFRLEGVFPGEYTAVFSSLGFETLEEDNISVDPGQVTEIRVRMAVEAVKVEMETVDVYGSFKIAKNPLSVFSLSAPDFQDAPESSGAVSRLLHTLPGISFISDENLDYVIRGGNPLENSFYVDNIEVPSIDHIHMLGSQGGFYSSLNPNLVHNIDFFSGCFSSEYGDRLSSVTRITLQEGNRERFAGTADISLAGAGAHFEGPFTNANGTWILSLRRSHLNVLKDLGADLETVPHTLDSQVKVSFDLSPQHKLNFLNFYAGGKYREKESDIKIAMNMEQVQNTTGFNWISHWNSRFFSSTAVSFTFQKRTDGEHHNTGFLNPRIWKYGETSEAFNFKNTNFLTLGRNHKLDFGVQIRHRAAKFEYLFNQPLIDYFGRIIQAVDLGLAYRTSKYSLYSSYIARFWERLIVSAGLRGDYSSAHKKFALSPRLSLTYRLSPTLAVNGGIGVFYQTIPMNYLAHVPDATLLNDMQANHYVLGLEYMSLNGIRFTLELYSKEYDHLPISLDCPYNLLTDLTLDYSVDGYFPAHILPSRIVDKGTASSRGVEFLFQKRWLSNFSTILSISYFRSLYTDLNGVTHSRVFDNQYVLNFLLKYRPYSQWEVSGRWISMGGSPYTPMDNKESMAAHTVILDRSQLLAFRFPVYNRINLRVSRLFFSQGKTIHVYAEVWNFLNQNLDHQLGLIPLIGIKYQF
jgi:hypothetical protein